MFNRKKNKAPEKKPEENHAETQQQPSTKNPDNIIRDIDIDPNYIAVPKDSALQGTIENPINVIDNYPTPPSTSTAISSRNPLATGENQQTK